MGLPEGTINWKITMGIPLAAFAVLTIVMSTLCGCSQGTSIARALLTNADRPVAARAVTLFHADNNIGRTAPDHDESSSSSGNGPLLVCYYTPTKYFPPAKVPADACTHLIYAFGKISSSGPEIEPPTSFQRAAWATLTSLRQKNPGLKVLLSLQEGFRGVVTPDADRMKQFATNCLSYLRQYGLDGVDLDWEPYPKASDKGPYATMFQILREAITQEAKSSGKPALLLSAALPNNHKAVDAAFDIPTISRAVDFGTAMTYDFHVYSVRDNATGYNSPLFTPDGDFKYMSSSAMAQFYLSAGMNPSKLLLGIPTYGRSWMLASPSNHGLGAAAVGKGPPGPYRGLTGIYTYPDACVALKQGAQSVYNATVGAVYLYKDVTWVAYDDVNTVTLKSKWARQFSLGGLGVWAMHTDDVDGVCGAGPLPLIAALRNSLLQAGPRSQASDRAAGPGADVQQLDRELPIWRP